MEKVFLDPKKNEALDRCISENVQAHHAWMKAQKEEQEKRLAALVEQVDSQADPVDGDAT